MAEREQFLERDLRGARFVECDLSGVVMRGVDVAGMDIDAPRLAEGRGLRVNGVDVTPWVEAELDRRNPHDPAAAETVRSCLHVVLQESWEHLRFALRDLDAIESSGS